MTDEINYFKDVVYLVEATGYECLCLWRENDEKRDGITMDWKEVGIGGLVTIGYLDNRPVNLSFRYNILNGKRVCFWDAVSSVVDHSMINDYLDKLNIPRTNAMNFHQCIHAIESLREGLSV